MHSNQQESIRLKMSKMIRHFSWLIVLSFVVIVSLAFLKNITPNEAYFALKLVILGVCIVNVFTLNVYQYDVVFEFRFNGSSKVAKTVSVIYMIIMVFLATDLLG